MMDIGEYGRIWKDMGGYDRYWRISEEYGRIWWIWWLWADLGHSCWLTPELGVDGNEKHRVITLSAAWLQTRAGD